MFEDLSNSQSGRRTEIRRYSTKYWCRQFSKSTHRASLPNTMLLLVNVKPSLTSLLQRWDVSSVHFLRLRLSSLDYELFNTGWFLETYKCSRQTRSLFILAKPSRSDVAHCGNKMAFCGLMISKYCISLRLSKMRGTWVKRALKVRAMSCGEKKLQLANVKMLREAFQ